MLPWETNMVHVQSALSHIAKEFFFFTAVQILQAQNQAK